MCSIDYYDGETCDFYSVKNPKARKEHNCCECGRKINIGEKYYYHSGSWGGDFQTYKNCSHCDSGAKLLMENCNGYVFEGMQEDLKEHVHQSIPWAMKAARVVVGMKRKWKKFSGEGLMLEVSA